MSQVVYTELEGQPLRWVYKGTVPRESRQEADRTPKTWSVSTSATDLRTGSSGTGNAVYGSNMLAQTFKNGANATKVTAVKLYGAKVGSPANHLYVEIRKPEFRSDVSGVRYGPASIQPEKVLEAALPNYFYRDPAPRIYSLTAGNNTLVTLAPNLPSGRNVIIAIVNQYLKTTNGLSIMRGTTTISSTLQTYNSGDVRWNNSVALIAVDDNAPENATYSLVINVPAAENRNMGVFFIVFQWNNAQVAKTNTVQNIANGVTATVLSLTPGYSSGTNVVISILGLADGGISGYRIKKDTTIVSAAEFGIKGRQMHFLLYRDTTPSAATQYSIEVYNDSGGTISVEAILFVMNVSSTVTFVDSAAIAMDSGTKTFNHTVTLSSGTEALVFATFTKNNWGSGIYINGEVVYKSEQIRVGNDYQSLYNNDSATICSFFPFRTSNPTMTINIYTDYANTSNMSEYKFLCIPLRTIPSEAVKTVKAEMEFPIETSIKNIDFKLRTVFSSSELVSDVTVEVFQNDVLRATSTIAKTALTSSFQTFTTATVNLEDGDKNTNTKTVRLLLTMQADYMNNIRIARDNNTYTTVKRYFNGNSWSTETPMELTVRVYGLGPSETVVASASIGAGSVSTTAGWITIGFSLVLRPNELYSLVVYTIGGDASNYYNIHNSGNVSAFGEGIEYFLSSTNSGSTWTLDATKDLSLTVTGVTYTQLYSGSIPNNIVTPLGKVIAALIIKAQTSSSMEFAGFDDHTYTAPVVSSNASSQTFITVLKPEDPRLRSVPPSDTVNWSIWGAGTGLSTGAYTQRYTYYTANPVYPKDFGFGELYLTADEIPPQGLVVLNDNTATAIYNPSTTATRVDAYEMFRVPVRKIEVIQEPTSGNIVLYLIGLP